MNKFKVGDRIAFYATERKTGTIKQILEDGSIVTENWGDLFYKVHPKQCRRLVKKTRREYWIKLKEVTSCRMPDTNGYLITSSTLLIPPVVYDYEPDDTTGFVKVREVVESK